MISFSSIFFFKISKFSGSGSKATTLPVVPTSFEKNNVKSPIFAPISTTVSPFLISFLQNSISGILVTCTSIIFSTTPKNLISSIVTIFF